MKDRSDLSLIPLVLLVGVLWGLNWPAVKVLLTEVPPLTIRGMAFPAAALLLAAIAVIRGESLRVPRGEALPMVLTGLFVVFGFNMLTVLAQVTVPASNAAIIAYTMPAITAVLAAIFLRERAGLRVWMALGLGMAGLAVLASADVAGLIAEPLGPGIMVLAALSWSIGNVMLKARKWSMPPLALTVWFFVVSTLAAWPLIAIFEPPVMREWPSAQVMVVMVYHVAGPMVACYALWTILVARLPATVAGISVLTSPVVGVLSAAWLLDDPLTWQKGIALAMIVASVVVTLRRG